MKRKHWVAVAFATLTFLGAEQAQANILSDVVGARAKARAGGPLSDHDVWLLERYGALSGTPEYWKGYKRKYRNRRRGLRRYQWDYYYD